MISISGSTEQALDRIEPVPGNDKFGHLLEESDLLSDFDFLELLIRHFPLKQPDGSCILSITGFDDDRAAIR
jgi:hypothetical protein